MRRSIIDHDENYPAKVKIFPFDKYVERKDLLLTRSQAKLLAEDAEEQVIKQARFRAMLEANEVKKAKEAALAIPDIKPVGSTLLDDGTRPIRFKMHQHDSVLEMQAPMRAIVANIKTDVKESLAASYAEERARKKKEMMR